MDGLGKNRCGVDRDPSSGLFNLLYRPILSQKCFWVGCGISKISAEKGFVRINHLAEASLGN